MIKYFLIVIVSGYMGVQIGRTLGKRLYGSAALAGIALASFAAYVWLTR